MRKQLYWLSDGEWKRHRCCRADGAGRIGWTTAV